MNKEIQAILQNLDKVLNGHPWYGKSVYNLLQEVDETRAYDKPNDNSHTMADLLYHMVTWAEFTQKRIEKEPIKDMAAFDALDWRQIDPTVHTWQKGLAELKTSHQAIIDLLQSKDDAFLNEKVDYRNYDFRYLVNGLIQHNIYHLGQIAYLHKMLA
jgi:uncharacterized damage-inducible protein DinB